MLAELLRRALAWLRRNPTARAEALELAAASARARSAECDRQRRPSAARRLRERAAVFETRAAQLRKAGHNR